MKATARRWTADHFEISLPSFHSPVFTMGKKATKSARKFAASGQLKKTIQARHKHQQVKKKFEKRRGNKGKTQPPAKALEADGDEDEEVEETENKCAFVPYFAIWLIILDRLKEMTADDFLGAGFMEEGSGEVCRLGA